MATLFILFELLQVQVFLTENIINYKWNFLADGNKMQYFESFSGFAPCTPTEILPWTCFQDVIPLTDWFKVQ